MSKTDITLNITFSPYDIDVLERIRQRWGHAVDETGIIEHILTQYYDKTNQSPPSLQFPSER